MAVTGRGKIWKPKNSEIAEHLKKARGRVTYACKTLGVHYETLKIRVAKEPKLQQLIIDLRTEFDVTLLDAAENCLLYALSKKEEDVGNALRSTFYILNNKGGERGYSYKNAPNNLKAEKRSDKFIEYFDDISPQTETSYND